MDIEILAYYPDYMEEFECIGSACSNSCCIGWTVHVDKQTYKDLKKQERSSPFNKQMMEYILPQDGKERTDPTFATIAMEEETGRCSFLDPDNRCAMYKHLGHDAMSSVCCNYPRIYIKIDNKNVVSAVLSCPEVTRMALLNKDGIKIKYGKLRINSKATFNIWDSDKKDKNYHIQKNSLDILIESIGIMQRREYEIAERLMLLGFFASKISKCANETEVKDVIETFKSAHQLNIYSEELKKIKPRRSVQVDTLVSTIRNVSDSYYSGLQEKYKRYTSLLLSYMSHCLDEDRDDYPPDIVNKYNAFLAQNNIFLENYLVNTMLESGYPYNSMNFARSEADFFYVYMVILMKFIVLRSIIIAVLYNGVTLDEDGLLELINLHSRSYGHSLVVMDGCITALEKEDMYSLAGAMVLAKV